MAGWLIGGGITAALALAGLVGFILGRRSGPDPVVQARLERYCT